MKSFFKTWKESGLYPMGGVGSSARKQASEPFASADDSDMVVRFFGALGSLPRPPRRRQKSQISAAD
jgi:hypothetical protein